MQYDYNDEEENADRYGGSKTPPKINLANISEEIEISLWTGREDEIVNQKCIDVIVDALGVRIKSQTMIPDFAHNSFAIGTDMSWTSQVLKALITK